MGTTREAAVTLGELTRPDLIYAQLSATDRSSILRELATRLAESGVVPDADRLYDSLQEREELGSTGIGSGVAVPHCKVKGLNEVVLAIGLAEHPIDFDSADGKPVRAFFVVLSPPAKPAAHLQSLSAISRWVQEKPHLERLLELDEPQAIFASLQGEDTG